MTKRRFLGCITILVCWLIVSVGFYLLSRSGMEYGPTLIIGFSIIITSVSLHILGLFMIVFTSTTTTEKTASFPTNTAIPATQILSSTGSSIDRTTQARPFPKRKRKRKRKKKGENLDYDFYVDADEFFDQVDRITPEGF